MEQHSKKPDEVRERIVTLMGDDPRVELFARQQAPAGMSGATRSIAVLALRQGCPLKNYMIDEEGTQFLKLTKQ